MKTPDTNEPLRSGRLFGMAGAYWLPPFRYDDEGQMIVDANGDRVLDVRGWGHLTGQGSHRLCHDIAESIQGEIGYGVAQLLNQAWPNNQISHAPLTHEGAFLRAQCRQ